MCFIRAVDPFHRTVMPKSPINRDVLHICKAFESNSIKLNYLYTKSLESLDPNRFKTHFSIHRVLRVKIWMIDEEEIDA